MLKTYLRGMASLSGVGDPILIVLSLFETTFTLKRKTKCFHGGESGDEGQGEGDGG